MQNNHLSVPASITGFRFADFQDIIHVPQTEDIMQETNTGFTFAQLVDIDQIQRMLESDYRIRGILSAILDSEENILVAAGWQDICTRFHRANPDTCKRCRESDALIKTHLHDVADGGYLDYVCKNGLRDVAVPIIIAGEHLATFFTGQFFYTDDNKDVEFFRAQARQFGFDEESYLEALRRVPVFTREQIRNTMDFYRNLVQILAEMGLKNMELTREVDKRKNAEAELLKSEERYTLAVDRANDGIWDRNIITGEVYYSPRWKSMLGYEDHEIPNKSEEWRNRIHPDDYSMVMGALEGYLEGKLATYEVEYRLQHKNGSYHWIHARGACLRDSQGKPYRIAGSHTDITSRKIAEELLKQNEALFRAVLETLPVGVWILEKDGRVVLSNEAARKIWAGARCLGTDNYNNYKGWWHETGKPISREEWAGARAIDKGETSLGEIIDIECFDGNRKIIVNSAVPLINDKGEVYAAVIVNEDITDFKFAEKMLIESEKKYRILFEESKDALLVSDPFGKLLDANQAAIELFGYTREELFSLDPVSLYYNADDRKRMLHKLISCGFVNDYEVEMKRKDDEKIIVHLTISALRDEQGNVFGHRGIARDVTERRKLEQLLLQAQKMESIGLLAGGVAHDFNNLLTAISGYGQILEDHISEDDELLRESIEQVLKAARRASELTRSLLTFSRKQVINPKPVLVDTIISNTGKLMQRIIGEDIEFTTALSDKKLVVMADSGQIEQVLMNLATNARDAMPSGGRLSISTKQALIREGTEAQYGLLKSGKYAMICVADTGPGIAKKSLDKLFEPFYTTKEVGKGTGLGLSIVYGIIKQHDGSVLVSSKPGKGTTFTLYLPLIEGCVLKEDANLAAPLVGGLETLLVAEDEEVVRAFLKRILEKAGYRVIVAGDGEEAVAQFREHGDISLVLSDVVMPKKNGKEILAEIRKIKPGIKMIFISGYTADIIHQKGEMDEGVEFIPKPFTKHNLLQKIRAVLDEP
jgi:two-component system, cell cycle sensor histidine kinase and response regulator CckA